MSLKFIISSEIDLRGQISEWRGSGARIGFVPTMGALHAGHISLITQAKKHVDKIVASIYINESQFAAGEDLASYPRDTQRDCELLQRAGCDLVFTPEQLYRSSHSTSVQVGGPALGLESDHRPHFFGGVALIVTKLLNLVQPDTAIFGEKDYQQLLTIRKLTTDLNIPVRIIGAPIIREPDGLAMSSRNRYFNNGARKIAGNLSTIMFACAHEIANATHKNANIETACSQAKSALLSVGFERVDYVAVADTTTLAILSGQMPNIPARLLIAAHCQGVRLIDNCAIEPASN